MGLHDVTRANSEELRQFVKNLLRDLRAFEKMLDDGMFESGIRRIGAEQEIFLVDSAFQAAPIAMELLKALDDPHYTTELGQFNVEYNLDPVEFGGKCLSQMEAQTWDLYVRARVAAQAMDADVVMTGILPTLKLADLSLSHMTPLARYHELNAALCEQAGGAYSFRIKGADEFIVEHDNVMMEACNTSFQVHFQVGPEEFAKLYNISQVVIGPIMAAATNSPLLLGKRLWRETRLALFQQSVDHRSGGKRERVPRVSFGTKWVDDSVLEIFREDVTRFRVLLNTETEVDPFELIARGEAPKLKALLLHNGTVYRWNRPCYGISDNGKPHLRIENRVLPAGPTPQDEMANAAFWFGLMIAMSEEYEDVTKVIGFDDAKANLLGAAQQGLGSNMTWVNGRSLTARDLVLKQLIPMARQGLKGRGIDGDDIDRYLEIIERRVRSRRTGSTWILNSFAALKGKRTMSERLSTITAATIARQCENDPVHNWALATPDEGAPWKHDYRLVEQVMRTDLFTVNQDELIDLVASVMDWQNVRHVPVEDDNDQLVGLVTYRTILRHIMRASRTGVNVPVNEIMKRDVVTCTPEMLTVDALNLMREHGLSCLPVVQGESKRLVGMITEEDFVAIARDLLEEQLSDTAIGTTSLTDTNED